MNIIQQIKLLLALKKQYNTIKEVTRMKAGIKSTEFWLAIISIIVSVWFTISGIIPSAVAMEVIKWVGVIYIIARAIVKATATTKDDEFMDKIDEIISKNKK